MTEKRTIALVGAGLANGLVALRLATLRPELELVLIERGGAVGGEHTWSFHGSDLGGGLGWVEALATQSWSGYEVRFPGYARVLEGRYHSLRSPDLHARLAPMLGARLRLRTGVRAVEPGRVILDDGSEVRAALVLDGRGGEAPGADAGAMPCAFQKFFGLFVRTQAPHGLTRPVLMDARVAQLEGFRFVYALPWSPHELLVEDTRYSESPALAEGAMRAEIQAWLRGVGVGAWEEIGEERGVLPIPFHGAAQPQDVRPGVVRTGVAAGLFHPTTGYSLPEAARLAELVAALPDPTAPAAQAALRAHAARRWRRGAFFRRLNNMLFRAAEPEGRRRVMEQFYQRDARLIARFYAGDARWLDRARILSGRPPVPVARGLKAFFERVAVAHA